MAVATLRALGVISLRVSLGEEAQGRKDILQPIAKAPNKYIVDSGPEPKEVPCVSQVE